MSKIVLSDFREEGFAVEFSIEVNDGDNFLVSSELIESDPFQFIDSLLDYLDDNGMSDQETISLSHGRVVIRGFNSEKAYTENELKDSCAAEVFTENLHNLFCGLEIS